MEVRKQPFGPPPVLPDVEQQLEEYLLCPERLPVHKCEGAQKIWPRQPIISSLYVYDLSPISTTLKVDRDPNTGEMLEFREVLKIDRTIVRNIACELPKHDDHFSNLGRSSSDNTLWPSVLEELPQTFDTSIDEIDFENGLLTCPPGMHEGIIFKSDGCTPESNENVIATGAQPKSQDSNVNLVNLVAEEQNVLGFVWQGHEETTPTYTSTAEKIDNTSDDEAIIPEESSIPVLKISETNTVNMKKTTQRSNFAEEIDVDEPVLDFEKRIPRMAHKFEFELDNFQKQAILKLEENSNVFVAAHTSSGKTVIAIYAIALTMDHMTRAIYTSPIKALSNQKYKEFKHEFNDVGLITGDIQLNQSAPCLIMTTEILRSMLLAGSDVIRDLEYVIFDEVHYINDSEAVVQLKYSCCPQQKVFFEGGDLNIVVRGYVWEEVFMLLPQSVKIVMLSATVPNTMEFAEWVGSLGGVKKRKMFVISTQKRVVPLKHYLYTGSGGKTKNDCFLIRVADGPFLHDGYKKALETKEKVEPLRGESGSRGRGGVGRSGLWRGGGKGGGGAGYKGGGGVGGSGGFNRGYNQEKTMWVSFISYLRENDKLPVVAFTLSRNRCDSNAEMLMSCDLTTKEDKNHIRNMFNNYVKKLKEEDQQLPQVRRMQQLLQIGIGVHHSGILPILKEIVELLFAEKKVKLLFATETFAMGVNMPARTVVFDSIRKYGGDCMRDLFPAEYIQMAGRAGRRDKDKEGTVIILCKYGVPKSADLELMMLGQTKKLESQFKMTYSMILNLMNSDRSNIERMISLSYKEFPEQVKQGMYKKELQQVEKDLEILENVKLFNANTKLLEAFYDAAIKYLQQWESTRKMMMQHPKAVKWLQPSRVIQISKEQHVNKLGIIVTISEASNDKTYHTLILNNVQTLTPKLKSAVPNDKWFRMIGLSQRNELFLPDGNNGHSIIAVKAHNIVNISKTIIDGINWKMVEAEWKKRQMTRFQGMPISQLFMDLCESLMEMHFSGVTFYNVKDLHINQVQADEQVRKLQALEDAVYSIDCSEIHNFPAQFLEVFDRKELEHKRDHLKSKSTIESKLLYVNYQNKVNVLQHLNYINEHYAVGMKGKLACRMGSNELMITELVFENILTKMRPAEIAALLSSLVFQAKTTNKPKLTPALEEGVNEFKAVHERVTQAEKTYSIGSSDDPTPRIAELNFGLVEVVHEWALNKSFSKIVTLTDVQEGIIVRCIQQLNETLQDVKNAAKVVGVPDLEAKMVEASNAIKRDIVFAVSLYTQ